VRKKERDCSYVLTVDLEVFGDRGAERQTRRLTVTKAVESMG
jgi:hypothetical protein